MIYLGTFLKFWELTTQHVLKQNMIFHVNLHDFYLFFAIMEENFLEEKTNENDGEVKEILAPSGKKLKQIFYFLEKRVKN